MEPGLKNMICPNCLGMIAGPANVQSPTVGVCALCGASLIIDKRGVRLMDVKDMDGMAVSEKLVWAKAINSVRKIIGSRKSWKAKVKLN